MNILFIHRNLPPDTYTGVAIQVHRLGNALSLKGHKITVATFSERPVDALYNVTNLKAIPAHWLEKFLSPFAHKLKRILIPLRYKMLDTNSYDIVHIHGDGAFMVHKPNFLRTFYGTAHLEMSNSQTIKGKVAQWISYRFELLENKRYLGSKAAVGISNHISNHLPCITNSIPCMLPEISTRPSDQRSNRPELLFMGSIGSRKNAPWAIEILKNLRKEFKNILLHYVSAKSPEDSVAIEAKYGKKITENITFHTNITQTALNNLYQTCWAYLSLSSYEGFGVSIIESMAFGCIPVSTRTPGTSETIKHGKTGFFIDKSNCLEILRSIFTDCDKRQLISSNAAKESINYSSEVISSKYEKLYSLISGSSVAHDEY